MVVNLPLCVTILRPIFVVLGYIRWIITVEPLWDTLVTYDDIFLSKKTPLLSLRTVFACNETP